MAIRGTEVADAYITIHTDTSGVRKDLKREMKRIGEESGDEAADGFDERFRQSMSPFAQRFARQMRTTGKRSGSDFGDTFADAVRGHLDRLERDLADGLRSGSFDRYVRNFKTLEDAFFDGRAALALMNKEGRISKEVFAQVNAEFEKDIIGRITKRNADLIDEATEMMAKDFAERDRMHAKERENWDRLGRTIEAASREMNAEFEKRRRTVEKEGEAWDALGRMQESALREMNRDLDLRSRRMRKEMDDIRRSMDRFSYGFVVLGDRLRRMGRSPGTAALTTFLSWPFRLAAGGISLLNRAMVGLPGLIDDVVEGFSSMMNFLPNMVTRLTDTANNLQEMGGAAAKLAGPLLAVGRGLGSLGAAAGPLGVVFGILLAEFAAIATLFAGAFIANLFSAFIGGISAAVGILTGFAGGVYLAAGSLIFFLPILTGLVGAVGLLVPAVIPAVSALGKFKQAIDEVDPAKQAELMEEYRASLEKMGPQMQSLVKSMEPVIEGFDDFQRFLGERVFEGIGDQIRRIDLKGLESGLDGAARGVNGLLTRFLGLFENTRFMQALNDNIAGMEPILDNLGRAIAGWTTGLTGLIQAATPFATELSEIIGDAAEKWGEWALSAEGQSALQTTFENLWQAGSDLWSIITDVASALSTLFTNAGTYESESGETFLGKLARKAEEFKVWIGEISSDGRLDQWLTDASDLATTLSEAIGDIWEKWQEIDTPENRAAFNTIIGFLTGVIVVVANVITWFDRLWGSVSTLEYWLGVVQVQLSSLPVPPAFAPIRFLLDLIVTQFRKIGEFRMPEITIPSWVRTFLGFLTSIMHRLQDIRNFRLPQITLPSLPGFALGGITSGPSIAGEAGREAVVPLDRPLSQIDPSVRALAAIAQGKMGAGGGIEAGAIQIVVPNANPHLVAVSVMDELAAKGYG